MNNNEPKKNPGLESDTDLKSEKKTINRNISIAVASVFVVAIIAVVIIISGNSDVDTDTEGDVLVSSTTEQEQEEEWGQVQIQDPDQNQDPDQDQEFAMANYPYELILGDIVFTVPEYNFHFNDFTHQRFEFYLHQNGEAPFDLYEPLDNQMHWDGTDSWADYIHGVVEDFIRQYAQAREEGVVLSLNEAAFLENYRDWIDNEAQEEGITSDEFIARFFGELTADLFMHCIERDMLVHQWRANIAESLNFTTSELETFYDENLSLDNGTRSYEAVLVDVRHILVGFSSGEPSEEEIEEARLEAEAISTEWQEGEATEESFAVLASERTDDTASMGTGGLYTNIWRGQMVPAFDTWIFDPSREPGDTDIVETDFGFHIMYFVNTITEWEQRAEAALTDRRLTEVIEGLRESLYVERRVA